MRLFSRSTVFCVVVSSFCGGPLVIAADFSQKCSSVEWTRSGKDSPIKEYRLFQVPLDYSNQTAGARVATLCAIRLLATNRTNPQTLFFNPGGPGASGVTFMEQEGDSLMIATGGEYNLVSWDPRGVGLSKPSASCFKSGSEEMAFWKDTILQEGRQLEAAIDLSDSVNLDAFYSQVNETDKLLVNLGQRCLENSPDTFQYLGTTATVRDMVRMHDQITSGEKLINFWGFSYGSVIGMYFVNMFPERVGKVIIDGVVNPTYYANKPPHESWSVTIESAEATLAEFASLCVKAGPDGSSKTWGCPLAAGSDNSTAESVRQDISDLIQRAYEKKKNHHSGPGSAKIRRLLVNHLQQPKNWMTLAKELSEYKKRLKDPEIVSPTPGKEAKNYGIQAITCADAVDQSGETTQAMFEELARVSQNVSPLFGPIWGEAGFYCHQWKVRAVERYNGPWNRPLSNQIMVMGNKYDPRTPFSSARSVAEAFGKSAFWVERDNFGHTTDGLVSKCTSRILQGYLRKNNNVTWSNISLSKERCKGEAPFKRRNTTISAVISATLQSTRENAVVVTPIYGRSPNANSNTVTTPTVQRHYFNMVSVLGGLTGLSLGCFHVFCRYRRKAKNERTVILAWKAVEEKSKE